jgi:hypothetical protein
MYGAWDKPSALYPVHIAHIEIALTSGCKYVTSGKQGQSNTNSPKCSAPGRHTSVHPLSFGTSGSGIVSSGVNELWSGSKVRV